MAEAPPLVVRGDGSVPISRRHEKLVETVESGDVEFIQLHFHEQDMLLREASRLESPSSERYGKCGVKVLVGLALMTALTIKISEVAVSRRSLLSGSLLRVKQHNSGNFYRQMRNDPMGMPNQPFQPHQQYYTMNQGPDAAQQQASGYGMIDYLRTHPSVEGPNHANSAQSTAGFNAYQQFYQKQFQPPGSMSAYKTSTAGSQNPQIPSQDVSGSLDNSTASNSTGMLSTAMTEQESLGNVTRKGSSSVVREGIAGPLLLDPTAPFAYARTAEAATPETRMQQLNNFRDNWDPYDRADEPVFWHIPKAGGSSIKDIIGSCHNLVMASDYGVTDGHANDTEIAVVYPKSGENGSGTGRSPFVNVDTTTVEGIQRAKAMGFADAGLAGSVVTPFIYESNDLFTGSSKGRLFSLFRHPIDRAVSMFYYLQIATWEPTYNPEFKNWTLEQYAQSDLVENNWMTRLLSQFPLEGDIPDDRYVTIAMEVVRHKFLVGLMSDMEASMDRFEKFFRWKFRVNPTNQESCRKRLLSKGSNSNAGNKSKAKPKPGSPAWDILANQNRYDIQLYGYIKTLFKEQEAFVAGHPENYRLVGGTCCKCDPPTFPPEGFECPLSVMN